MIRTIHLHGAIGRDLGRRFDLDVDSPAEAVRALCAMVPGFRERVEKGAWQVIRGRRSAGRALDAAELRIAFGADRDLHLVPRASGAARRGLGKVLLGAVLIGASFLVPAGGLLGGALTQGGVATLGVSLGLTGLGQILAPQMASSYDDREQPRSRLFAQGGNVSTPGAAVPVIAGRVVTSYTLVVSSAVDVQDA